MQYAKLGESNLEVSRICLGCMGFGDPQAGQHSWTVGEDETRVIVKRAPVEATGRDQQAVAGRRLRQVQVRCHG